LNSVAPRQDWQPKMSSKSVARNRLRTAQETQRKWAGIFYRAFQRQAPFTAEERAALGILSLKGNAGVFMPCSRSWADSALYVVSTFVVEAILARNVCITVTIYLDKAGPNHDFTVESFYTVGWNPGETSHLIAAQKRDWIEFCVTEWAWAVLRREVAPRRMAKLKEELMAAAWAPARVERWLAAGLDVEAL
jgi:hypothetical protein